MAESDTPSAANFACYLIDHCEGEVVSEELVQLWLSRAIASPQYAERLAAFPAGLKLQEPVAWIVPQTLQEARFITEIKEDAERVAAHRGVRLTPLCALPLSPGDSKSESEVQTAHLTSRPTKVLLSARSATLEDLGDDGPVGHGWQISVSLDGHAGPGVYAHMSEYPEEGSIFLAAIPSALPEPPIYWRHRKTRGVYRLVGQAQLQTDAPLADMAHVMVYQGADGKLWARAASEYAGRFDRVAAREARVEPIERSNSEPAKPDEKAPVSAVGSPVSAVAEALQVLTAERDTFRALFLEWEEGLYDGPDFLRRVRLALHGPLSKDHQ